MLKNYFRIALRNLWRNKGFSAITIFGLAIGMATCLLITLFVTDELSYDRFNKKAGRVFRLDADFFVNGNAFRERFTPSQLGPVLKEEYPQVENYVRFIDQGDISHQFPPGILQRFSYPFIGIQPHISGRADGNYWCIL